jgi:KGK domain
VEIIELGENDVVNMGAAALETTFTNSPTSKISEIKSSIFTFLGRKSCWFSSGVHCQVLREAGGGWERGKLRLVMVFEPDSKDKN